MAFSCCFFAEVSEVVIFHCRKLLWVGSRWPSTVGVFFETKHSRNHWSFRMTGCYWEEWKKYGDWEEWKKYLRKCGPTLPQKCKIEDDLTLGSCELCVCLWVILFMLGYAVWFLTLTEVQPASIWVAPRKSPEVSFQHLGPSNNKLGDYGNYTPYCDHPEDYSCKVSGWPVHPKGQGWWNDLYHCIKARSNKSRWWIQILFIFNLRIIQFV